MFFIRTFHGIGVAAFWISRLIVAHHLFIASTIHVGIPAALWLVRTCIAIGVFPIFTCSVVATVWSAGGERNMVFSVPSVITLEARILWFIPRRFVILTTSLAVVKMSATF